jgi:hypothetical protein
MTSTSQRPRGRLATSAIALEVFLGLGAIGGGIALILGPKGEILPLPVSALAGSPFDSYLVPGLILLMVLGIGPLVVALLSWRGSSSAPFLAVGIGLALLIWLAVQIAIIGFSLNPPLQPIYLVLGVVILGVGLAWLIDAGRHREPLAESGSGG